MKEKITKYVEKTYGTKLNDLKNRMNELSHYPQNYKQKDKVYFKETKIKIRLHSIVNKQFRTARKRKDTIFFPTYELAYEYHKKIPQQLFIMVSDTLDKFIPIVIEKQLGQMANVKDINLGDVAEYIVKTDQ